VCSYLLQENSVLVVAKAPGLISAFIFSILVLMKPFLWQCAIVPILPKQLWESIDAPIPFILGIPEAPAKFTQGERDYLIVDLDLNMLKRPRKYVPMMPGFKELCESIANHKHQCSELHKTPLQHRRAKLVEDVINDFKENNNYIIEEVSGAVLSIFEKRAAKSGHKSPAVNFLDDDQNVSQVLSKFDSDHHAFYNNFLRTQLFSVHALDLFMSIAAFGDDTKDQEMMGILQQLILMEEKSKEVLQEYARCGVARLSPGLDKATKQTQTNVDMLKVSRLKLEGEVTKKRILSKNFMRLTNAITSIFKSDDGEKKKGHRRTRSHSEYIEKRILSRPLNVGIQHVTKSAEEPGKSDRGRSNSTADTSE